MALNFDALTAAVTTLSADVAALIPLVNVSNPADQAKIDAVTSSIAALDATVKAAEAPPAAPTA